MASGAPERPPTCPSPRAAKPTSTLAFDDLGRQAAIPAGSLTYLYRRHHGSCTAGADLRALFRALRPQRPHACFSITKSYAATLAATLIHERALDERKPVAYYLPEMAATAYEDATLRQVLDMQVGSGTGRLWIHRQIWDYSRAGAFARALRTTPARATTTNIW